MQETYFDLTTAPDPVLFNAELVATYDGMSDAGCDGDCDLDCAAAVSENDRLEAHREFHSLSEKRVAQNLYLCGCVELKQRVVDAEHHIIEQTAEFWLRRRVHVKVCKTFFARTLGLPDARLDALLEPDTFEWFTRQRRLLAASCSDTDGERRPDYEDGGGGGGGDGEERPSYDLERPFSDFVLDSRKYLEKNHSAFVEETDSDMDEHLDNIDPSVYKNVISHIQNIPRVVSTLKNPENDKEKIRFESSIKCHYLYLNYLKKSKKNKKKINEKQYKKIYNEYMKNTFMVL